MSVTNSYTEANIKSLEGLEPVRKRPTQFLPDTEAGGITHAAKEIIDNSLDELAQLLGPHLSSGILRITLCRDIARGTFQLIIRDNGRGIPIGSLVRVLTQLSTSGKYDTTAYKTSAGLFGQGAKVVAGTSFLFRSLSFRPDGIGSLFVKQGQHAPKPDISKATDETGVTTVYEPDPIIFTGLPEYAEYGYIGLLDLLKKYVFFTPYPIEFRISDKPISPDVWEVSNTKAIDILRKAETAADLIWAAAVHDRDEWIRHYWHLIRPFAWKYEFHKTTPIVDMLHDYRIKLFFVKFEQKGGVFGMVNNVPIDNPTSNHLSVVSNQLTTHLAKRIADKAVRTYFQESFTLPIFIAADVRYEGAQFAGTTKNGFTSAPFRESYQAELTLHFSSPEGTRALDELFVLLKDTIESSYMQSLSSMGKVRPNMNRLFLSLKRPDDFNDCSIKDRSKAELFVVEGQSAGGAVGQDPETQATLRLRGKPENVITHPGDQREMLRLILKNDSYQDFFKIINYDPLKPTMTNLHFGHCLLMMDGDAHGRHIAAILIGTFWVAAPELVKAGFFSIVAPPYYEVWAGKKKTASTYVRDQIDLPQWKTLQIYNREIFIDIEYMYGETKTVSRLTPEQLVPFVIKIDEVGRAIENLANEFSIPGLLVEALTRVSYYLSPETMNIAHIKEELGANRVEYDVHINTLVISIGREDYVIPLYHVRDRLCDQVSIILQRIEWRNWNIYVSSKRNKDLQDMPMSIYQLYELFKTMDRLVSVKVLKGIGSMNSTEVATICMDPRNRRVYKITSPGDVDVIFDLLGDDPQPRKDLMVSPPMTVVKRGYL